MPPAQHPAWSMIEQTRALPDTRRRPCQSHRRLQNHTPAGCRSCQGRSPGFRPHRCIAGCCPRRWQGCMHLIVNNQRRRAWCSRIADRCRCYCRRPGCPLHDSSPRFHPNERPSYWQRLHRRPSWISIWMRTDLSGHLLLHSPISSHCSAGSRSVPHILHRHRTRE